MSTTEGATPHVVQPQCQFFVVRKKRLCRMTVRPGRQYCGEHEPQPLVEHHQVDKRIPCPNDPKHTCYASKLEKHLTKCNARQLEDPPYIVRNLNAPDDDQPDARVPLKLVPAHALTLLIQKVNELYDKHVRDTVGAWAAPAREHPAVAASIAQAARAHSSRRHLRQAGRLLQLCEQEGLVADHTCYVELGAGKGLLSYYMGVSWCGAGAGSSVLCVDRASLRHKRDNLLRGSAADRLRADLRHVALHGVPRVRDARALVGLAKHLCGVATDYALASVCGAGVLHKTRGAVLATCCHHRCRRAPYVGAEHLRELGITDEELNIMFSIVSWATCGDGRSRERRLVDHQHTSKENEHITQCGSEQESIDNDDDIEQAYDSTTTPDRQTIPDNGHTNIHTQVKTKKQKLSPHEENTFDTRGKDQDVDTTNNDATFKIDTKHDTKTNSNTEESLNTAKDTKIEMNSQDSDIRKDTEANTNTTNQEQPTDTSKDVTFQPLDIKTREEIGRRAKALIDHGRVLYLRDKGFQARLCYYVPTTESLENLCIVASKPLSSTHRH